MTLILNTLKENEYASYYKPYLEDVEEGDIASLMIKDLEEQLMLLESIKEEKYQYSYQTGKWSIAELILHVIDSESVFAYRSLSIARNDKTDLPGFDQDEWAKNSNANTLSKNIIIGLFKTCRNHSIALYKSYQKEKLLNIGSANNVSFSVRSLAYIIIGHNRHHFNVLKDHYLS